MTWSRGKVGGRVQCTGLAARMETAHLPGGERSMPRHRLRGCPAVARARALDDPVILVAVPTVSLEQTSSCSVRLVINMVCQAKTAIVATLSCDKPRHKATHHDTASWHRHTAATWRAHDTSIEHDTS